MADKMTVSVKMVPLQGKPLSAKHEVPVTVTGTTLGSLAKSLKLDLTNRNVMVDGKPASTETIIKPKSKLEVTEVRVTERPRGS